MMQWYFLTPLDVLLFRESKPFSPSDGSWAKGLFPPMPITVFQAMRSLLPIRSNRDEKNRDIEFIGPFLVDEQGMPWMPTPKDLILHLMQDESDRKQISSQPALVKRLSPAEGDDPIWSDMLSSQSELSPMVAEESVKRLGIPYPLISAKALQGYLEGKMPSHPENKAVSVRDFSEEPWDVQILPHTHMNRDKRQVQDENGYFTEVAIRLKSGWRFMVGMDIPNMAKPLEGTIRLGGEGHRVLVSPMDSDSSGVRMMEKLKKYGEPSGDRTAAYLLTPGLAEMEKPWICYGVIPKAWVTHLKACASDRAILWGGVSKLERLRFRDNLPVRQPFEFALLPQRAFVAPGSVYIFREVPDDPQLLPGDDSRALETFRSLNYGVLLWGVPGYASIEKS